MEGRASQRYEEKGTVEVKVFDRMRKEAGGRCEEGGFRTWTVRVQSRLARPWA